MVALCCTEGAAKVWNEVAALVSLRLSPTARVESDINQGDKLAANVVSSCTSLLWKNAQWGLEDKIAGLVYLP